MVWKKIEVSSVGQFVSEDEDVVLTIIKTGFEDNYILVFDSATDNKEVLTERLNKEEIFKQFNIEIINEDI